MQFVPSNAGRRWFRLESLRNSPGTPSPPIPPHKDVVKLTPFVSWLKTIFAPYRSLDRPTDFCPPVIRVGVLCRVGDVRLPWSTALGEPVRLDPRLERGVRFGQRVGTTRCGSSPRQSRQAAYPRRPRMSPRRAGSRHPSRGLPAGSHDPHSWFDRHQPGADVGISCERMPRQRDPMLLRVLKDRSEHFTDRCCDLRPLDSPAHEQDRLRFELSFVD